MADHRSYRTAEWLASPRPVNQKIAKPIKRIASCWGCLRRLSSYRHNSFDSQVGAMYKAGPPRRREITLPRGSLFDIVVE